MKSTARLVMLALLAVLVALALRLYVAETIYIASGSMEPTLHTGARFFSDKMTFRLRAPRRCEIIVFRSPLGEHESVKRVIAVAGDTVELRAKKVFINGVLQDEPCTQYLRPGETLAGDNMHPVKVPPGSLFVLGDNRDASSDSATWKDPDTGERIYFIALDTVTGKLRGIYLDACETNN